MRSVTKEKKEKKYFKVLDLTNKNRPREKKGKKGKCILSWEIRFGDCFIISGVSRKNKEQKKREYHGINLKIYH